MKTGPLRVGVKGWTWGQEGWFSSSLPVSSSAKHFLPQAPLDDMPESEDKQICLCQRALIWFLPPHLPNDQKGARPTVRDPTRGGQRGAQGAKCQEALALGSVRAPGAVRLASAGSTNRPAGPRGGQPGLQRRGRPSLRNFRERTGALLFTVVL